MDKAALHYRQGQAGWLDIGPLIGYSLPSSAMLP
jgi:hypothetical protein